VQLPSAMQPAVVVANGSIAPPTISANRPADGPSMIRTIVPLAATGGKLVRSGSATGVVHPGSEVQSKTAMGAPPMIL
jgi:hypothetical protein